MTHPTSFKQAFHHFANTCHNRVVLLSEDENLTWGDLRQRVNDATKQLGPHRRLVLLETSNTIDSIIWYLACLVDHHPVLLTSAEAANSNRLAEIYRPDTVVTTGRSTSVDHRFQSTSHSFHNDLAILLTTSGSTSQPKLVRLSYKNLQSNTAAIIDYLDIDQNDRAITTLPMNYCYGLSVINTHILSGASIVLTQLSALDPCFWDVFDEHKPTSLAGVPHTFDLLNHVQFGQKDLSSLRYVTQAGGRLEPSDVSALASTGEAQGWKLFVMYGQTEATARMAYLPPDEVVNNPASIGRAIPGGHIHIKPILDSRPGVLNNPVIGQETPGQSTPDQETPDQETPDQETPDQDTVGEIVYRGPNVMMGYAQTPDDLRLGAQLNELRTGDLAKINDQGLIEIVGRSKRIIKPFGVRVDLDQVERQFTSAGFETAIVGDDQTISVATTTEETAVIRRRLHAATGLSDQAIRVAAYPAIPRLANGKIDYPTVAIDSASRSEMTSPPQTVAAAIGSVLSLETTDPNKSFVELGGDSLSYIEASVALKKHLGGLPENWQTKPIGSLSTESEKKRWWSWTDSTLVLRCVAITLIVATHIGVVSMPAGSHVLLAVAGFNFAQFQLMTRRFWPTIARVAIPAAVWMSLLLMTSSSYAWSNLAFVNNIVGAAQWGPQWRYWFIEVLLQTLVGVAIMLGIPAVRKLEENRPFEFAFGLLTISIITRFNPLGLLETSRMGARTLFVLWAFVLGWAAAKATSSFERFLLTGAAALSIQGFFNNPQREMLIFGGLVIVIWLRRLPLPSAMISPVAMVGKASLWIYLVHWQIYGSARNEWGKLPAFAICLVAGVIAWQIWAQIESITLRQLDDRRTPSHQRDPNISKPFWWKARLLK